VRWHGREIPDKYPTHGAQSRCGGATLCMICRADFEAWLDVLSELLVEEVQAMDEHLWTETTKRAARADARRMLAESIKS
jgi:hypothetical protein